MLIKGLNGTGNRPGRFAPPTAQPRGASRGHDDPGRGLDAKARSSLGKEGDDEDETDD